MGSNFISYFDILGYKDAILNSASDDFAHRVDHILRDIELSLSLDQIVSERRGMLIGDERHWVTNVHFISDTIVFWPTTPAPEHIENWLLVSSLFNNKMNQTNMPVRGSLVYNEFQTKSWSSTSSAGGIYTAACIFGKALVLAHLKAENQSWAGTTVDQSVIDAIQSDYSLLMPSLEKLCSKEMVPYKKSPTDQTEEFVLRIFPNVTGPVPNFEWYEQWIKMSFTMDGRNFDSPRVQEIYRNTIALLRRQLT
jgi:hypothetical protein